jgi:hypothetical protein
MIFSFSFLIGLLLFSFSDSYLKLQKFPNYENDISFSIAMTSIPPRFKKLEPVLLSWLEQSYQVERICLYIPKRYKRFKRKISSEVDSGANDTASLGMDNLKALLKSFSNNSRILSSLEKQQLKIIIVDKDMGPITKFYGVLLEQRTLEGTKYDTFPSCFDRMEKQPNFWIFADDDVYYSRYTVLKYYYYLVNYHSITIQSLFDWSADHFVLTQFVEDYRVFFNLTLADGSNRVVTPRHLQGVDTYLVPNNLFLDHWRLKKVFSYEVASQIIEYFHEKLCPESFYQDDYVISFLFALSSIPIYSIWNNDKLTSHLDGISVDNFQMHKDRKVFLREDRTKSCIFTFANDIFQSYLRLHS